MNLEKYQTFVMYESGKLFVLRNVQDLGKNMVLRNVLFRFGACPICPNSPWHGHPISRAGGSYSI